MVWESDYFRLFITHVATHKSVAHEIKRSLQTYNISCFVAHADIAPTREWEDEIVEALRSMDALAALLSSDFHESKWTDQEVGFAVETGRLVLPLRLGLNPYGFIAKYQGYDLNNVPYTTIARDIPKILARHGSTSLIYVKALVKRLERSWAWEAAKTTMTLLEECAVKDEELLQRIEGAMTNPQVEEAWGVPERIKTLVERHRHVGSG